MGTAQGLWQDGKTRHDLRENTAIMFELWKLVAEGLLEMSVSEAGEAIYWATPTGREVLGMV